MKALVITLAILFGMLSGAEALPITITPASVPQWTGSDNSNLDASEISAIVGGGVALVELYKQDVGGPESGIFAASYNTTFSNTAMDPEDALIEYVGGPSINSAFDKRVLYVKDGNQDPAFYIFDLTLLGWDGVEDLVLDGFWPRQGAISHVAILGQVPVPEPGTLTLLGLGVMALGLYVRFKA
jgi:hypothetical protein